MPCQVDDSVLVYQKQTLTILLIQHEMMSYML